jgi:D-alanine-D-alanine ligase
LLDSDNNPFVLEANTIPGMTETSLLPKAAAAKGIAFGELCLRIADISLKLRA